MKDPTRLLRTAYWIGIVLDAAALIPFLVPKAAGAMLGITDFAPSSDYRYAAANAAALMAGWTALLLWADREPVQRRGVLVLTVFPVLVGLIAAGVYAVGSGLVDWPYLLPVFVVQVAASTLFIIAFLRGRAFAHTTTPDPAPSASRARRAGWAWGPNRL